MNLKEKILFHVGGAAAAGARTVPGRSNDRIAGSFQFFEIMPLADFTSQAGESGAEATAVQTLRVGRPVMACAERLDCGRLTAAFARTRIILQPDGNQSNQNQQVEGHCCARGRARSASAFSLVELLVVMALLTLIVLALMNVFSSTQRAFRASVTQSDVLEGSRAAMELITGDLRGMSPSNGTNDFYGAFTAAPVNFFALPNGDSPTTNYTPLQQYLPGGSVNRTNLLNFFFILGRQNTQWTGIGYVVNTASGSPLYPLYRFYAQTNISQPPRGLFNAFIAEINQGQWTNMSHVLDGVVHLVVRAYDPNGVWLTNGYSAQMTPPPNASFFAPATGEVGFYFLSNAIPASVELQLGVIEDHVLARAESLPYLSPAQTSYLLGQSGSVHIFRQQVNIPSVDRSAYP